MTGFGPTSLNAFLLLCNAAFRVGDPLDDGRELLCNAPSWCRRPKGRDKPKALIQIIRLLGFAKPGAF